MSLCIRYARGDAELAKDLVQEVSVQMLVDLDKLREGASEVEEHLWLRWRCLAARKRYFKKYRHFFERLGDCDAVDDSHSEMANAEMLADIMSHLSETDKQIIQLEIDGYNKIEIADMMNININALYQRRHRIIARLKEIYISNKE